MQVSHRTAVGTDVAWRFLCERWADVYDRWGGTFQSALILKAPAAFASEPRADEVRAFFGAQPPQLLAGAERAIAQADEKVRTQARWLATAEWQCDSV